MDLGRSLGRSLGRTLGEKYMLPVVDGLALWLDAADTGTITESGGAVSVWADKSGGGNNATQGNGANKPTTGTRTINGLNALDFNGSSSSMVLGSGLLSVPSSDNTMFIVAAMDVVTSAVNGYRLLTAVTGGNSTRYGIIVNRGGTDKIEFINSNSSFSPVAQTETIDTNANIFGQRHEDTTLTCLYDGLSGTGASSDALDVLAAINIGSSNDTIGFFDGLISEVLIYERAFSDAEINQVGNYLQNKWNANWSDL